MHQLTAQSARTPMNQELETIDCTLTEDSVKVCSESYTANQLAELLSVSVRSIYGYANKLIEAWYWLPESEFRNDGIYTAKALTEMDRLKNAKSFADYARMVAQENKQAITPQVNKLASAIVPAANTAQLLEVQIVRQQSLANQETNDAITQLRQLKAEIDTNANRSANAQKTGREARIARLKARAMRQALEDFQVMQEVYTATIEQLEVEQLQRD